MLQRNINNSNSKKFNDCKGAVFVEYAIAVALLLAVFIVVNQIMESAFKQRAKEIIDNSDSMPVCDEGDIIDSNYPEACL